MPSIISISPSYGQLGPYAYVTNRFTRKVIGDTHRSSKTPAKPKRYVHGHFSEMKHSIENLRSTRTVCGSGLSSTNYPGRMLLGLLCGPSTTLSTPSVARKERSYPYRVPHLAKRHIGNIIYFDDDVILAIHVGQVLTGRNALGHPGNIAFDYEDD